MAEQTIFDAMELLCHDDVRNDFPESFIPCFLRQVFSTDIISLLGCTNRRERSEIKGWMWTTHHQASGCLVTEDFVSSFLEELCLRVFDALGWIERVGSDRFRWINPYSENTSARRLLAARRAAQRARLVDVVPDSD
jgi:hypothetical protein